MRKVLLIGLDGATLDLIGPWVREGRLPTFKRIMNKGVYGELKSIHPLITPMVWTSAMSGKNPGKHGIFEFTRRKEGSYGFRPVTLSDRKTKVVWNLLSEAGKRVIIVNDPVTYPAEKVNGIHITGNLSPSLGSDFVYPKSLREEIVKRFGYRLRLKKDFTHGKEGEFFRDVMDMVNIQCRVALHLLKREKWDFFFFVFSATDTIAHRFWHFMDKSHPFYNKESARVYGNAVLKAYQEADKLLKDMIDSAGKDTVVIVMSDHGMGPLHKFVHFNNWLIREGFMKLRGDMKTRIKWWSFRHGINIKKAYRLLKRIGLIKYILGTSKETKIKWSSKFFLSFSDVDWRKTRAYAAGNLNEMYINLKGREPMGIVEPGKDYNNLIREINQRFGELRDPVTKEKILDKILVGNKIYKGHYMEAAPDMIINMKGLTYLGLSSPDKGGLFPTNKIIEGEHIRIHTGIHRENGVVMMYGPGVKKGEKIGADITDIAPTILYLLGVPIPSDCDGKVIKGVDSEFVRKNRVKIGPPSEYEQGGVSLSEEEQERVKESLKRLGYEGS